ncbi:MAG TPA: HAMP domain-containing methyl-accepting chemotaxis protein [Anaeromyxobacteraceae bacterium]|nr:HAMP domain-containing methyl-accepting chemotaxis protein [Anaeromyxobacteraceae bacterium]
MFAWLEQLGLKRSIYLTFSFSVVAVTVVTMVILNRIVRESLESALRRRGESQMRVLEMDLALASSDTGLTQEQIDHAFDPEDGAYAIAVRGDGAVLARRLAPALAAQAEAIVADHARRGFPPFHQGDGLFAFSAVVRHLEESKGGHPQAGRPQGRVLLGLSTAGLDRQLNQARLALAITLAAAAAFFAGLGWALSSRLLFSPVGEMRAVARRLSESDLSARAGKHAEDELGSLAESLNRIGENLTVTLARVKGVTDALGRVIERIKKTGTVVASGVGTVSARVIDTSFSMEQMIAGLRGIANNVEVLAQSAEESSSSILEMAATNDEVAENIQGLAASVEETTAAIEQMTYSIKEVAKNVEELSATSEETSSSMNEMDVSISQVEMNANETAKLSEQATRDAEMGTEALGRTLNGIDKIKASSREAAAVIEALGRKIGTVGSILGVIDDVAEQTNLLALNAAILAAQSGEHGKGFAVVADEIKDLAERTGASTKEISELVRSVQEESKNAVHAMERGVKAVEEGVKLGQEAEGALRKIQDSSRKSTQMVNAIARATVEQARGSKQVTMAISRIAETVQQIAAATAEQARGSEQIMKSAEKMKIITKHVERSSQEQARGSKQVTKSIESISEMVNHINRAQKDQTRGSEQVMSAVVQIKQVAEAQTTSVRELESAISDLVSQAQVLGGEVKRFKL